jgi:hypothetical protein
VQICGVRGSDRKEHVAPHFLIASFHRCVRFTLSTRRGRRHARSSIPGQIQTSLCACANVNLGLIVWIAEQAHIIAGELG